MATTDFHGMPTYTLQNEHLRLEVLASAGPRIVRLFPAGSPQNLLAELPDMQWDTPHGPFRLWGGHRLWHAPETATRTYFPDDSGLQLASIAHGVRLAQPAEAATGIAKSLEVTLEASRPGIQLRHELRNEGVWPVTLAPWAITQLPLGGTAILPQRTAPLDPDGLQPNRSLALWPYTRWQDPRLHPADDYFLVTGEADEVPCKVGYFNHAGWLAYWHAGVLFVKEFQPRPGDLHPDLDSNAEVYVYNRFLELETLGPLQTIAPGESAIHYETWLLSRPGLADLPAILTPTQAAQLIASLPIPLT